MAKPQPVSDKDGHYIVRVGDVLDDTRESPWPRRTDSTKADVRSSPVRITRLLGQGTFGKVVCAKNIDNGQEVAVKIMYALSRRPFLHVPLLTLHRVSSRAVPKYRDASKVEIKVLRKLAQEDPDNRQCVDRLSESVRSR